MASLVFAGDESKDADGDYLISAGGFAAQPAVFFEAERLWQKRLEQDSITYFRATECANLRGEFQKFRSNTTDSLEKAHARAERIRDDLIAIINRSQAIIGFSVTLVVPDFRQLITTSAKAHEDYGTNPEILVFRRLIVGVLEMIAEDSGTGHTIDFEFDAHSNWGNAEEAYKLLRGSTHDPHKMLGHIRHRDDKNVPALQMADLMAYEARHAADAWLNKKPFDRPSFKALARDPNPSVCFMGIMTKENLLSGLAAV